MPAVDSPGEAAVRSTEPAPVESPDEPTHDDIAYAAYLRYLERGGGDGQDFDDWLSAERALKKSNNGG